MEYQQDDFSMALSGNQLDLTGKIEVSDYSDILEFLKEVELNISNDLIFIDLTGLLFLNSSGIRTLAIFIMKTQKKVNIKINESITWQKVGIVPLQTIKNDGSITVSS